MTRSRSGPRTATFGAGTAGVPIGELWQCRFRWLAGSGWASEPWTAPAYPRTPATGRLLPLAALVSALLAGPAAALDLPSGVKAEIHEVLVENIGAQSWVRFRLLAAEIDRARNTAPGFAELEQDFPYLCAMMALPYLKTHALEADKIVISIADRPVEFGVSDPEATQYFEQFRIEGDQCVWEGF